MIHTCKPLVAHLDRWCQEHLGRHDSAEYHEYLEIYVRRMLEKHEEKRQEHTNHGYFGMSKAGGCLRAAAYSRAGVKGKPFNGSKRVTFELGHNAEVMALAMLEASGFEVTDAQTMALLEPTHCSYTDGIVRGGPVDLPYPMALSVKSNGYKASSKGFRKGFAALPLDGVKKEKTDWYAQIQLEMRALGLNHGLVLVLAKDMIEAMGEDSSMQESGSLSIYAEVVPVNHAVGAMLEGAYESILDLPPEDVVPEVVRFNPPGNWSWGEIVAPGDESKGWGGPNREANGKFNLCNKCDFAELCREAELRRNLERSVAS